MQSSGKKEVAASNVLVAIFGEKQSHAVYLLNLQDVTRLDVVNFISHGVAKAAEDSADSRSSTGDEAERDPDADPIADNTSTLMPCSAAAR